MNERICAYDLARSFLAEMPRWKRVEFLAGELVKINDLEAAAYAHTLSPHYNMPISFQGGVDMEEVRATVRGELMAAEERSQVELRRLMHD